MKREKERRVAPGGGGAWERGAVQLREREEETERGGKRRNIKFHSKSGIDPINKFGTF
jgi:hypothetical protein